VQQNEVPNHLPDLISGVGGTSEDCMAPAKGAVAEVDIKFGVMS